MNRENGIVRGRAGFPLPVCIAGVFIFLLLTATNALCRDVTFTWTANPEDVDGYRLYYKTDSSGPPYDGTGAVQGSSPITLSNVTTFSLNDLSESETYYFALTAYADTAESAYSVEIVLEPLQVNSPPTASDATLSITEDVQYSGQLSAGDPDGDALIYSLVSDGSIGNVSISDSSTGAFTYSPFADINGTDTFTFKVNDGMVDSGEATVTVDIAPLNDSPTVADSSISTTEETPVDGQLFGSDPDGDTLSFAIVANGDKGKVTITDSATGVFTYVPDTNATGSDVFTFRAGDGELNSATATVDVFISAVNDAPVANDAAFELREDTSYSGQLTATDADGDSLTFYIAGDPTKGNVIITNTSTGNFSYTPADNATGSDSFTFRVNDATTYSTPATVNVSITVDNTSPVAGYISVTTKINTEVTGQLPGSDADGDPLSYSIESGASKGLAEITDAAYGTFRYTPAANEMGSDSFTYKINDGELDSAEGMVSITIVDETVVSAIFGDNYSSDYPGTVADTYADVNDNNYSTSDTLRIHSWWKPQQLHKPANTMVMKVNLSVIPTYATIVEAKLVLYQTLALGETLYDNFIHKITGIDPFITEISGYYAASNQPWTALPAGTTYEDIPLGLANIAEQEDVEQLSAVAGYKEWSITDMVQEWVATPSANYGLLVVGEETATETGRSFASSEHINEAFRPQVVVSYKTIPPAPQLIIIEEIK